MNYAQRLKKHLPKGMEIEAIHPLTGHWHPAVVTGTWSEDRIRQDFDQGAYIEFDGDNQIRQISAKFIVRNCDKPDFLGISETHVFEEYIGMTPQEALQKALEGSQVFDEQPASDADPKDVRADAMANINFLRSDDEF